MKITKGKWETIWEDLDKFAYNPHTHTYDVKETNQIIRTYCERLQQANKELVERLEDLYKLVDANVDLDHIPKSSQKTIRKTKTLLNKYR